MVNEVSGCAQYGGHKEKTATDMGGLCEDIWWDWEGRT